jgi:hypothetical protein
VEQGIEKPCCTVQIFFRLVGLHWNLDSWLLNYNTFMVELAWINLQLSQQLQVASLQPLCKLHSMD